MKKLFILSAFLVLVISLVSCSSSDGDKLTGSWTITSTISKETFEHGAKASIESKQSDTMLQAAFQGATLELKKDKSATMKKDGKPTMEYTWKMDESTGRILELDNKEGKAEILFRPVVKGAESLFFMKGINTSFTGEMIFTADNTACIADLIKK